MPPPRVRAATMKRLSSYAGEEDTSTSPERQDEVCDAYALSKDWEIVARISDLDVSASDKGLRLDRPGLIEARKLYPTIDVLLVPKLDRLARNVKDFMSIVEEAQAAGVAVVLIAEGLDLTTASGRFVAQILAAFAELEAATISQRTLEAVAFLAREGRHRGGSAPFGWQIVPRETGAGFRLDLDPATAPHLRSAALRVIAGESAEAVCEDMHAKDIPGPGDGWTPRKGQGKEGPAWHPDPLRRLLRRPILRGYQVHRGELVRGEDGLPIRPHTPLVDDAEWRDLQAALDRRTFTPRPDSLGVTHLQLRGLVSCDMCGAVLHAVSQDGKPPVWTCSRKRQTPAGTKCPGLAVSRANLESYVVADVLARVGSLPGTEITEEERADEDMAVVSEALDATLRALRDVEDPTEEDVLLTRRRALRARLTELQAAPVLVEAAERPTGTTFAEDYAAANDAGKATLLASALSIVSIRKGRRGRHGLDPSRVELVYTPSATSAAGGVRPGVIYRRPVE